MAAPSSQTQNRLRLRVLSLLPLPLLNGRPLKPGQVAVSAGTGRVDENRAMRFDVSVQQSATFRVGRATDRCSTTMFAPCGSDYASGRKKLYPRAEIIHMLLKYRPMPSLYSLGSR